MPKTTYHIEPLNKDYDTWAIQAEAVLVKNKLWKYVETAPATSSTTELDGDRVTLEKPELYLDNETAIKLSHNPKFEYHKRTKHIKLKHLFVRECVTNGELTVKQVPTATQLGDMLTKPLYGPRLEDLSNRIGLRRISNKSENS